MWLDHLMSPEGGDTGANRSLRGQWVMPKSQRDLNVLQMGHISPLFFIFLLCALPPSRFGLPRWGLFGCCLLVPFECGTNPLPFPGSEMGLDGFLFVAVPQVEVVNFMRPVHSKHES